MGVNHMEAIDKALNTLEFYLRGKFRAKYNFCQVRKFYSPESHFYVDGNTDTERRINFKYTSSCYIPKPNAESEGLTFAVENDDIPNNSIYLKIPRKNYYSSTWGKTDYIVCQFIHKDEAKRTTSWVYYINKDKLFTWLSKGVEVFEDFVDWDIGIPLRTLMKLKIVDEIDKIEWSEQRFKQVFTTQNRMRLEYNYFINRWDADSADIKANNTAAFFPRVSYQIKYADRRKKVVLTSDTGMTLEYSSIVEATNALGVTAVSMSRVLNKKQKKLFCNYDGKKIKIVSIEEI